MWNIMGDPNASDLAILLRRWRTSLNLRMSHPYYRHAARIPYVEASSLK
jgi:hypothetical protein